MRLTIAVYMKGRSHLHRTEDVARDSLERQVNEFNAKPIVVPTLSELIFPLPSGDLSPTKYSLV